MNTTKAELRQLLHEILVEEEKEIEEKVIAKKAPNYITDSLKYVDLLKSNLALLNEKHNFNIGDIVVWKEGLKNRRFPEYSQPGIVIQTYNEQVKDNDSDIGESYDIQIGFIEDDSLFFVFNYNSSRFTNYVPSDI